MARQIGKACLLALVAGLLTGATGAQNSTNSESLGDVARQLKAQQAKPEKKPRVYTNDDLAPAPASSAATGEAKSEAKHDTKSEAAGSAAPATAESREETHGEKYFRDQMSKLQNRLGTHQRELSVLEQKLGQNQMMYYPDPNKGLLQESGPTAMSDVHALQDEIDKKKAEISADEEAIESLQEQLRRDGGDPGWLRMSQPPSPTSAAVQEQPKEKPKTREEWQARFKSVRSRLADAQEQQQLAEDELNLLQIQFARELNSDAKTELADKIKAKEDEVSQNRAATAAAHKALEELQDEFKAGGFPNEWIEPEG